MVRIAIVDDEAECRERLEKCISAFFAERTEEACVTPISDGVHLLTDYSFSYDIIFLDIEMQLSNGMKVAQKLRQIDPKVILVFCTKLAQYAVDGYTVDAIGYILKPARYGNVALVLTKAMGVLEAQRKTLRILLVSKDEKQILESEDILYIEVLDHVLIYHTTHGDYHDWGNLSKREKELQDYGFFRCHRCYLINLAYVTGIPSGNADEVCIKDIRLPVSRSNKAALAVQLLEQLRGKAGVG